MAFSSAHYVARALRQPSDPEFGLARLDTLGLLLGVCIVGVTSIGLARAPGTHRVLTLVCSTVSAFAVSGSVAASVRIRTAADSPSGLSDFASAASEFGLVTAQR